MSSSKLDKLCEEYRQNKLMIAELEEINAAIRDSIIAAMGSEEVVYTAGAKCSYKEVKSQKFDSGALKREDPDMYKRYVKEVSYKRFSIV